MFNHEKYILIGIGDFSHGDENIWTYRINFVKELLKNTKKKITIFNEDNIYHSENIMNFDKKLSFYKTYGLYENKYPYGPLSKYCNRVYDSPIYLEFIKLIRKNSHRLKIVGIDPDKLKRDKLMAKNIINKLNTSHINLFFAHNGHVDNRKITEEYETKWSDEKYRCGYYLKQEFGNKYCIILSTGYKGTIRFDCDCNDKYCTIRTPYKIPVFEKFEIKEYKNINDGLYDKFNENIYIFTACKFPNNKPFVYKTRTYDYVLFFKNVKKLNLVT